MKGTALFAPKCGEVGLAFEVFNNFIILDLVCFITHFEPQQPLSTTHSYTFCGHLISPLSTVLLTGFAC